jgi:hypothetical protein
MSYVPWAGRDFGRECIATQHTRATTWPVRLTPFTENRPPRNLSFIIIFPHDAAFRSKADESQEMPGDCVAYVTREDQPCCRPSRASPPVAPVAGQVIRARLLIAEPGRGSAFASAIVRPATAVAGSAASAARRIAAGHGAALSPSGWRFQPIMRSPGI